MIDEIVQPQMSIISNIPSDMQIKDSLQGKSIFFTAWLTCVNLPCWGLVPTYWFDSCHQNQTNTGQIPMQSWQDSTAIYGEHSYWKLTMAIHREDSQNNRSERHVLSLGMPPLCACSIPVVISVQTPCLAGQYKTLYGTCELCPDASFQMIGNASRCQSCRERETTGGPGATHYKQCGKVLFPCIWFYEI